MIKHESGAQVISRREIVLGETAAVAAVWLTGLSHGAIAGAASGKF